MAHTREDWWRAAAQAVKHTAPSSLPFFGASMSDKTAAFRERADYFRQLANRQDVSRLRDDLLRAAQEWDELAKKVAENRGASVKAG